MALDKLRKYCKDHKAADKVIIVVGFSQDYALEVHERTDIKHRVGQAKYLEEAARVSEQDVRNLARQAPTEHLADNLLKAGLLIQRMAQELTPVDTSALKSSAFTTTEQDLDRVAVEAREKAEALRLAVMSKREKR